MRLAVVGSRTIVDFALVVAAIEESGFTDISLIVSGGAKGVDSLAEQYAKAKGIECRIFKPDWDKYGKRAGFVRNALIVNEADALVAVWDGKSKGTMHSVALANERGIPVFIAQQLGTSEWLLCNP
jgi:predicted Rossmann fold nucleotide-binding protein DprA/Smf involved in DNA uptake